MRLFVAAALVVLASSASADRNAAYLDQTGQGNYVSQTQVGSGNHTEAHQDGGYNQHTAYQNGYDNYAESWQYGYGHMSEVRQVGSENSAIVYQREAQPPVRINQVGNGMSITVSR